jgi:hypothetical protein
MTLSFSPKDLTQDQGIVRTAFAWAEHHNGVVRKISWDNVKGVWLIEIKLIKN